MKKNSVLLYSVLGIFFAIFNILAFVIPSEKTATFWVAYGFTVIAFISQIFIFNSFKKTSQSERFSGLYAFYIGPAYLLFQLIVFFLFKFVSFIPVWISIIICTILFALFLILSIFAEIAKKEIAAVENNIEERMTSISKTKAKETK